MTQDVLMARDLWCHWGRHGALRGLDLSVPQGEVYALIGANGAGKTTAVKALMNLIPPTRGAAWIMGVESVRLGPSILTQVGYVAATQSLPGRMRVGAYLRYVSHFYPTWDVELERSLRERLEVPLQQSIKSLSYGTRMKLALVAALAYRPSLLVLDEPLAGLDPLSRDEFLAEILRQDGEFTLLITSHELTDIESITTRVGFMHEGRMLLEESLTELSARVREVRVHAERPAIPQNWPGDWFEPQVSGNVITFYDTRHEPASFPERLDSLLGPVRNVQVTPMPLRALFGVLERAAQHGEIR